MNTTPGVDMSTGSLGQGVSVAAGMALGAKYENKNLRVYTATGDGEIQEGQIWEAAMWAGFKKLDNLVVIVDNNKLQMDGTIEEVNSPYPIDKKFEAFNFHVINIDGHDFDQIAAAFKEAKETKRVTKVTKDAKKKNIKTKKVSKGPKESYVKKVKKELKLVKWPTAKEVLKYTISTVVFCLILCRLFMLLNLLLSVVKGWLA